jgi:ADP-heptose:LPS heptosyltransferase
MTRVVEQVIDATGAQVLIHEGPADRDAVDHLLQIIARPVPRLVQPELPLLAAVLASASAYLGGDSGVSHLAAAAGAPAVILFPEATRERWAPWSATAHVLAMGEEESLDSSVAAALGQRIRASQAPAE